MQKKILTGLASNGNLFDLETAIMECKSCGEYKFVCGNGYIEPIRFLFTCHDCASK